MKNFQTYGIMKVVCYGRVSTKHEAQTYALGNQLQWYEELKKNYSNWRVVEKRYVDDGTLNLIALLEIKKIKWIITERKKKIMLFKKFLHILY